jgi:hypothetical protein
MSFLTGIAADMRDKRLWPVAAVLALALVAIPVLVSKAAAPQPVAAPTDAAAGASAAPATAVPAVSVDNTPTHSSLAGRTHDPFAQQQPPGTSSKTSAATTTTTTTTGVANTTTSPGSSASGGSTPSSGTAAGRTPPTSTPTRTPPERITPSVTPKPAPTGLTATQSYHVKLAITNSAGGLDTIDPLERLSVLPSEQQPLLVELGVLKGGRRVLFAVEPGTVLNGPGTCTPGPIDCEILSLAQDQTEGLSRQSPTGVVAVALFAVTAIIADQHSSAAAAARARRMVSAAGRDLLSTSTLSALSLFPYEPSLGAVVDLRNLTVGGG